MPKQELVAQARAYAKDIPWLLAYENVNGRKVQHPQAERIVSYINDLVDAVEAGS